MNSRFYDILSLVGALLIVIVIAFVMNPAIVSEDTSEKGDLTKKLPSSSEDLFLSDETYVSSGRYSSESSENNDMWVLASRISGAMDYYEPVTRDFALRLIPEEHSGDFSIAQACDLWDGAKKDWTYEYDSYGIWDVSPASRTINTGFVGDQNDFAVFVASLIKSTGGQSRIKLANSPQAGEHTYAELYLGNNEDFNKKIINSTAFSDFKSKYSGIFAKDPYGINIFKYKYVNIESGGTSLLAQYPLKRILNEPEKYSSMCYEYPKMIEYILINQDMNVIDFQIMYLKFRYGGYTNPYVSEYSDVSTLRDISYSSELEKNNDKSFWLKLDWFGSYPGDSYYNDLNYATVFYSDSSWNNIRFSSLSG